MANESSKSNSSNNSSSNNNSDGKMTVQEAGHLGGEQTSKTHGKEFYEEIGSEGGKVSPGNFKNDPERAAKAGSHSHDNDNKREDSDRKAA